MTERDTVREKVKNAFGKDVPGGGYHSAKDIARAIDEKWPVEETAQRIVANRSTVDDITHVRGAHLSDGLHDTLLYDDDLPDPENVDTHDVGQALESLLKEYIRRNI